jgi:hypothetical protein
MIDQELGLPSEEDLNVMEHYKAAFSSQSGLVVLHHLIRSSGVFDTMFNKNAGIMAYNEGRRAIVLDIMRKIDSDTQELRKRMLEAFDDNLQRTL